MYCRSCGKEIADNAAICMSCGVPTEKGNSFCPRCGGAVNPEAVVCVNCGQGLSEHASKKNNSDNMKSSLVAGILALFLGSLGVPNFYLGFKKRAIAQLLLTLSGFIMVLAVLVVFACAVYATEQSTVIIIALLGLLAIILGCICGVVSGIWAFVEAILLLCGCKKVDGKGNLLKD